MKLRNKSHNTCGSFLPGLLSLLLLLLLPAHAAGADTSSQARQLINAMSGAGRQLNYDGIFVYRHGSKLDTMRIIHKADGGKEQERLVSLTGFAREVVRDSEVVTCYFPDNQAVLVEKSRTKKLLSTQLPEPIEKIAAYYDFSVGGKDRVAGRTAWVVNITPKDDYRYGYQLWIDEETKLMLKSELKDDSGWPVEQILFTSIAFLPEIPPELLKPAISGNGYTWYSNSGGSVASDSSDWEVTSLPTGFMLTGSEKQDAPENGTPLEHMIYSDGLAMVSVFIEQVNVLSQPPAQPTKIGGVNTFARYTNGYQITAVGEVPMKTVRLMANSVVPNR
ncbi:MAG: MucB/RseB C-terminal domain-containing protein [Gammaproteobacteria bacterium]